MNYHEKKLIEIFIIKKKRNRYLQFLESLKNRKKFIKELAHFKDFDARNVTSIPENQQNENDIENRLNALGAKKECYIISEDNKIDATQMQLKSAIHKVLGKGMGTIISCIPGKLAYYEGEDERLILNCK